MKKRILFVDDEQRILDSLQRMLRAQRDVWEMTFTTSPHIAWEQLREADFDALVSDIKMPGMDGLQLLQCVRQTQQTRHVPVVILTGLLDRELKQQALDLGATDLLNKPVEITELVARLRNVLQLKAYEDELRLQNTVLDQRVRERTQQLDASRIDIIWRLGKAAEFRDEETGNHVIRVACYSRAIARVLGQDRDFVDALYLAAPLHDIGKIGISDSILLKPGKLTEKEWSVMKQHCEIGARILREESRLFRFLHGAGHEVGDGPLLEIDNPFLETAARIAMSHHEKWNGKGYPRGLTGEEIPLESRIVAISDVFDALTSERPYKPAYSEEKSLAIIREGIGTHFDPEVVAAFESSFDVVRSLRKEFSDQEGNTSATASQGCESTVPEHVQTSGFLEDTDGEPGAGLVLDLDDLSNLTA